MNANETCEDSIHGPYEPDDVADVRDAMYVETKQRGWCRE